MPVAQACFIVMKVCEGLDYAHNKRDQAGRELHLVHRDVSPQNVLVSFEGEVKLIDFGIAKAAGKGVEDPGRASSRASSATCRPSRCAACRSIAAATCSRCGIVLYELLTGERLFVGESDFSTLEKVRNVEILPPSTYNRRIPDELERIVLKALAKDVDDRYQNAIDLHDELQAFVYTAGEFYSRKDLAAWMKKTSSPQEIEEETAKLESIASMPVPPVAPMVQQPMPGVSTAPQTSSRCGATRGDAAAGAAAAAAVRCATRDSTPIVPPPPARAARCAGRRTARSASRRARRGTRKSSRPISTTARRSDAGDAVVDDKPDLSKARADSVTARRCRTTRWRRSCRRRRRAEPRFQVVETPEAGRNGAGAKRRNPFDYVLPADAGAAGAIALGTDGDAGVPAASAVPSRWRCTSAAASRPRRSASLPRAASSTYNSRPGTLFIASDPATNVQILLDNKRQAVDGTPATLKLEPGSYVSRCSAKAMCRGTSRSRSSRATPRAGASRSSRWRRAPASRWCRSRRARRRCSTGARSRA